MSLGHPIQYCCTFPGGGQDVIEALLSDGEFPFARGYSQIQMALVGVMSAADLIQTALYDKEAAVANFDKFAIRYAGRGAGFARN